MKVIKDIRTITTIVVILLCSHFSLQAQQPKRYDAVDIYQKLEKLSVLGNALYVAAHPDDENTRMITYLSKKEKINTAYLSLTRGDGGQNSIGPEQSEMLGLIRTQELLAARKVDGGNQYFTRAMDFGYSKGATETLNIWNREDLLYDMVWVIRNFKPDVMITRFPPDRRAGHGQHEASAILAEEAFDMAADPNAFKDQLEFVDPWQPERLYLNTGRWWNPGVVDDEGIVTVDIGAYEPLTGLSYSELGADARSQHKSQAFGVRWTRGTAIEYLESVKGTPANDEIFEGIDIGWNRIGRADIEEEIAEIRANYDFTNPEKSVQPLLALRAQLRKLKDEFWKNKKVSEVEDIIKDCLGLYLEAKSDKYYASPDDSITFSFEVTNRSNTNILLNRVYSKEITADSILNTILGYNGKAEFELKTTMPQTIIDSNPYWLRVPRKGYEYTIESLSERGNAETSPSVHYSFEVQIGDEKINYTLPVVYTWTERLEGQQYRPFEVGPKVFTSIKEKVVVFADNNPKKITVVANSIWDEIDGTLMIDLPSGWKVEPASIPVKIAGGEEEEYEFTIYPSDNQETVYLSAQLKMGDKIYDKSLSRINYSHIPTKVAYLPAQAKAVKLDVQKRGNKVGYIEGAGDEVAQSLGQIGYDVTIINEGNIASINFEDFDAVVTGIMAFTNFTYLQEYNDQILDYVKNGGNLVIQYNNIRIGLRSPIIMPYPIEYSRSSSKVRVSVEDAEVRFLDPSNPVLNYPNKITQTDFEGWVQERGLYYPVSWDSNYSAVVSSNDPGEDPLDGGILVAKYGKGNYVYSAMAWFRQLPAGVPGAYRIFTNMVSLQENTNEN